MRSFPPGWSPKSVAQRSALEAKADILLFSPAAGSLKTETLLVDADRESKSEPPCHHLSAKAHATLRHRRQIAPLGQADGRGLYVFHIDLDISIRSYIGETHGNHGHLR